MEFLFAKKADSTSLYQGDLLAKNAGLEAAIRQSHSYYADAVDYTHFLVLTPSCDLVRRDGPAKTRYITIAAVRPLKMVIDRLLGPFAYDGFDLPVLICKKSKQGFATQFVERLLHNSANGYFFIRKDAHPRLPYDVCAFLALSIALGAEHYDTCLQAKIAQLDAVFSAKVGWLTGSIYSSIGTPDIEEKHPAPEAYKESFYKEVLYDKSAWLSPRQKSLLKQQLIPHP